MWHKAAAGTEEVLFAQVFITDTFTVEYDVEYFNVTGKCYGVESGHSKSHHDSCDCIFK